MLSMDNKIKRPSERKLQAKISDEITKVAKLLSGGIGNHAVGGAITVKKRRLLLESLEKKLSKETNTLEDVHWSLKGRKTYRRDQPQNKLSGWSIATSQLHFQALSESSLSHDWNTGMKCKFVNFESFLISSSSKEFREADHEEDAIPHLFSFVLTLYWEQTKRLLLLSVLPFLPFLFSLSPLFLSSFLSFSFHASSHDQVAQGLLQGRTI